MARSFVPEYVRRLKMLSEYVSKHEDKMRTYTLTAEQIATFAAIQAASAAWAGVPYREEP